MLTFVYFWFNWIIAAFFLNYDLLKMIDLENDDLSEMYITFLERSIQAI